MLSFLPCVRAAYSILLFLEKILFNMQYCLDSFRVTAHRPFYVCLLFCIIQLLNFHIFYLTLGYCIHLLILGSSPIFFLVIFYIFTNELISSKFLIKYPFDAKKPHSLRTTLRLSSVNWLQISLLRLQEPVPELIPQVHLVSNFFISDSLLLVFSIHSTSFIFRKYALIGNANTA